jgi:hypothetical protein
VTTAVSASIPPRRKSPRDVSAPSAPAVVAADQIPETQVEEYDFAQSPVRSEVVHSAKKVFFISLEISFYFVFMSMTCILFLIC